MKERSFVAILFWILSSPTWLVWCFVILPLSYQLDASYIQLLFKLLSSPPLSLSLFLFSVLSLQFFTPTATRVCLYLLIRTKGCERRTRFKSLTRHAGNRHISIFIYYVIWSPLAFANPMILLAIISSLPIPLSDLVKQVNQFSVTIASWWWWCYNANLSF